MFKNISIVLIVFASVLFTFGIGLNDIKIASKVDTAVTELYKPVVVLELFTSQGCSSCPVADQLLNEVRNRNEFSENTFTLSYHVDYWNYIGWKDPFSNSKYADKQRMYNNKFKNRSNYTPQLVINGKEHFVGSNRAKVYQGIQSYMEQKTSNNIDLFNIKKGNNLVTYDYVVKGSILEKNARIILVLDQRITEVKQGENRNRTLKNSNVVIAEKKVALSDQIGSSAIAIPKIVRPDEKMKLFVLVENSKLDITAAAKHNIF